MNNGMQAQLQALKRQLQHWWSHFQADKETDAQDAKTLLAELQPHTLSSLLPYHAYDPDTQLYVNKQSAGFILETTPLTGANEETVNILATLLTDTLSKEADFQVLLCASDKVGHVLERFEMKQSKRFKNKGKSLTKRRSRK